MTPRHGEALEHLARELLGHKANRALVSRLARQADASWSFFRQATILLIRLACIEYGMRPWKGFLWSPLSLPDLEGSVLDPSSSRGAVALLPPNIAGLAEWYEALLAHSPRLDLRARTLHLERFRGSSRKRWGSFSTPPRLIEPLLDSALDPLLGKTANLLDLKICDPACGSGGLLFAAACRIAAALDRIAGSGSSLSLVVRHCLYGVDRDPIAAELCKLRLSQIPGIGPDKLNVRICCGNSLIGTPLVGCQPDDPDGWTAAAMNQSALQSAFLRERHGFFHWRIAFPEVFESGGFDAILGNPPWERVKHQRGEWTHSAPPEEDRQRALEESQFLRHSGRFPLSARGDLNYYGPFVESSRQLVRPEGRVGLVVPSGLATDDSMKELFRNLMHEDLVSWFDFHNRGRLFPGVQGNIKFGLLILERGSGGATFQAAGQLSAPEELQVPGRTYALTPARIGLLNPITGHCPAFASARDAELVTRIHERFPILQSESWGVRPCTMFHMTKDAPLFRREEELRAEGWVLEGNVFRKASASLLPLYEAKLIKQYNHRAATFAGIPQEERFRLHARTRPITSLDENVLPRYWVNEEHVRTRAGDSAWFLGFRNAISSVADARSLVAAIVPRAAIGNSLPLIAGLDARRASLLLALLNSFVLDYVLRQKASGGNLNFHVLNQLPVPPADVLERSCPWLAKRVVELTFTARDLTPFACACGHTGSPFLFDEDQRWRTRCAIDAALFRSYGLSRGEAEHVLDSFSVFARSEKSRYGSFRSRAAVLELFAD